MSTKSRGVPQDANNSLAVKTRMKNRLLACLTDTWAYCINNPTGKQGARSTGKTDILHCGIRESMMDAFGNTKNVFENRFALRAEEEGLSGKTKRLKIKDCLGSSFNVDLMLFDKLNGCVDTAILVKASMSSINKNRYNYVTQSVGEMQRILAAESNSKMKALSLNLVPKFSLSKKKDVLSWEKVNHLGFNTSLEGGKTVLHSMGISADIRDRIHEVNVFYSLAFKNPDNIQEDLELNKITSSAQLEKVVAFHVNKNLPFIVIADEDFKPLMDYCMQWSHRAQREL